MTISFDMAGVYPIECEREAPLVDGTIAWIRPIRPDDAGDLADFHEHLAEESVRLRFFAAHPHLRDAEIERFTRVDYWDRMALIAHVEGRFAGVARYDRLPGTDRAEVAFVVADERQGLGLGTLLLEHLSAAARRRGIACFVAETLWENRPMQEVFVRAGFACSRGWDGGTVNVSFPIAATQSYLDALSKRDASSVHAWLQPFVAAAPPRRCPDAVTSIAERFVVEDLANGSLPAGRVGVVCQSPLVAAAISSACRAGTVGLSAVVASRAHSDGDVSDLLAYLAADEGTDVIVVQVDQVIRPSRFVTRARAVARLKPLVALLPSPAGGSGGDRSLPVARIAALWEQAGVDTLHSPAAVVARAAVLLTRWQSGAWRARETGGLVDLQRCDPARARAVLDRCGSDRPGFEGDHGVASTPYLLGSAPTAALLAAYGVPTLAIGIGLPPDGLTLVITDDRTTGLAASLRSSTSDPGDAWSRALPLTDRDAEELVRRAAPGCSNTELLADVMLRAARLVEDQPELHRLEVPFAGDSSHVGPLPWVWAGPARTYADDPFVRQVRP